jgi:hypothetical protein
VNIDQQRKWPLAFRFVDARKIRLAVVFDVFHIGDIDFILNKLCGIHGVLLVRVKKDGSKLDECNAH